MNIYIYIWARSPDPPWYGPPPHPPVPHVQWRVSFPIASLHPYTLPRGATILSYTMWVRAQRPGSEDPQLFLTHCKKAQAYARQSYTNARDAK